MSRLQKLGWHFFQPDFELAHWNKQGMFREKKKAVFFIFIHKITDKNQLSFFSQYSQTKQSFSNHNIIFLLCYEPNVILNQIKNMVKLCSMLVLYFENLSKSPLSQQNYECYILKSGFQIQTDWIFDV